jgi:hypothetical protein
LLPLLTDRDTDIRLAAIMAFAESSGLSGEDRELIGPSLVRVAIGDSSDGHRQEALYSLALWRDPSAGELFEKLRRDHSGASGLRDGITEGEYWPHRFWVVATLGQTMLGDQAAAADLATLLQSPVPALRLEALLAYHAAGQAPAQAAVELAGTEPKIVATAVRLIALYGSEEQRLALREFYLQRPIYQQFALNGVDDHRILEFAGLATHAEH